VGDCTSNQAFAANGDAQQTSSHGLLAWRKADNWTAFTDGYRTWINGPNGLQTRLNTERFSWEATDQPGLNAIEGQFFNALNGDRQANGLSTLALNTELVGLARTRAQDLVKASGALSHYDSSGKLVLRSIMDDNHINYNRAGENLAQNNYDQSHTVQVANTGLMNSPTHRANILNTDYTQVGVGTAGPDSAGRYYYVQLFVQMA
jgi:uncharacterized protein YkwD